MHCDGGQVCIWPNYAIPRVKSCDFLTVMYFDFSKQLKDQVEQVPLLFLCANFEVSLKLLDIGFWELPVLSL